MLKIKGFTQKGKEKIAHRNNYRNVCLLLWLHRRLIEEGIEICLAPKGAP